jgi:hypothetical protein
MRRGVEAVVEDGVQAVVLAGLVQDRLFEIREEPDHLRVGVREQERERLNVVALEPDRVDRRGPRALREAAREEGEEVLAIVLRAAVTSRWTSAIGPGKSFGKK